MRKFKTLCHLGRSTNLTLSSNAGKVLVNLRVDLGVLPHEVLGHPPKQSRNGPSQLRRRERRAAARKADAEEAEVNLTFEEKEVLKLAAKAEEKSVTEQVIMSTGLEAKKTTQVEKVTATSVKEVPDEFCLDSEYGSRSVDDESKAMPKSAEEERNLPKPLPIRDRSLGGIDYYTATYEDPPFEDEDDFVY